MLCHDKFRDGQSAVVQAALAGQDVAVFWATGRGKSICYQLPALHSGRTAIVVSPLISLMTDQVERLNNTVGRGERQVAAFLGSAQLDPTIERRALDGAFPLVYMSPEKLMMGGTLERLAELHQRKPLLLFAIDEAHCVSEWGHDFRPEYQQLGLLRKRIPSVPIMALTATAVPKVQKEILTNLGMREPHVALQSSFRSNLTLKCSRKTGNGMSADLAELLQSLRAAGPRPPSTLIYVAKKQTAEDVAAYLASRGIPADFYHGSRTPGDRERVHLNFLSGKLPVVCATVAFGMGIDKPDIRNVVHYGAPKTAEEYYQHIGRAGRDGGPSTVHMLHNDADFKSYDSDFYLGKLPPEQKERVRQSIGDLRAYANDIKQCRWAQLLRLMGEKVDPGFKCGTCDNCVNAVQHAGDATRDFGGVARIMLRACQLEPVWSKMEKALSQKGGELDNMRSKLKPRYSVQTLREFLPQLVHEGYVVRVSQQMANGRGTYDLNRVTALGQQVLNNPNRPLMLPVPPSVRKEEEELKAKKAKEVKEVDKARQRLVAAGYSLEAVPAEELQPHAEQTPVLTALLEWSRTLDRYRDSGKEQRAESLELLHKTLLDWRSDEAARLRMAPTSVLQDHLALKICIIKPDSSDTLLSLGARITADGSNAIIRIIRSWREQHEGGGAASQPSQGGAAAAAAQPSSSNGSPAASQPQGGNNDAPMALPSGIYQPKAPWALAVKPLPTAKKQPVWEVSWVRFHQKGESLEKIAMTQENGKTIQVGTIHNHLLQALTQGRPCNLEALASQSRAAVGSPPSESEWEKLLGGEAAAGIDVVTTEKVQPHELLKSFLPEIQKDKTERTDAEQARLSSWYPKVNWFLALRRSGLSPEFGGGEGSAAKRPRVS